LRDKIKAAWTALAASAITQSYDGGGLRVKKTEYGATTWYLRSRVLGGQVIAELDATGNWARGYVYAGSSLMAVQQGGVFWVHEDPVTKSKRTTDMNGNVVSAIETDPWGADTNRSSNGAFHPRKYTSYDRDGNGSDEAMFRRYNRQNSRFDQPDPYGGSYSLSDPQSFNRYTYTENDPVNSVDPSGRFVVLVPLPQTWTVTVRGSLDDMTGYLPNWSGGFTTILFLHPLTPQNPMSQRPPKQPERIREPDKVPRVKTKEQQYKDCVNQQWYLFNQDVEKVTADADTHFEEREGPWWFGVIETIVKNLPGSEGRQHPGDPGDTRVDELNQKARTKEIEEGTQQAAKLRDQRIKVNCKKP